MPRLDRSIHPEPLVDVLRCLPDDLEIGDVRIKDALPLAPLARRLEDHVDRKLRRQVDREERARRGGRAS